METKTRIEKLKREAKEKDIIIQDLFNKVDSKKLDDIISQYEKSQEY